MLDAVGGRRTRSLRVHALRATIEALRAHVFNNVIWPDFESIPSPEAPFVSFHDIAVGQVLQLGTAAPKRIEVLPAVHTVPACGFAVSRAEGGANWVFTGDTERNTPFWDRLNALDVAMLVIETAFSNREQALAERSLHLSPARSPTSWRTSIRGRSFRSTSPTPSLRKPKRSCGRSSTWPGTRWRGWRSGISGG